MSVRRRSLVAAACAAAAVTSGWLALADGSSSSPVAAATPIQHLVVIFDENESFDHYFATYPHATNPVGEPAFNGAAPAGGVHTAENANLLPPNVNPNSKQPARIDRANALTCDQNHGYADEQKAFNSGGMDKFVEFTAGGGCADLVMDYFDGNTVTALWNLAQHFTMDDETYGSTFGPSTPGALNLIAGQTHGAGPAQAGIENGTMISDPNPMYDDCIAGTAGMSGRNIGDAMNDAGVTWGWFQGGFRPSSVTAGKAACATTHKNIGGNPITDYSPHHEPFMYYPSTANPHHLAPSSVGAIGHSDQANHQYDLSDFDNAVRANNLPQVSFLKPAAFEDAHPFNSDPLDEQHFIARALDELEQSPDWASTAVIITYDDSDGWYDHEQVVSHRSNAPSDMDPICNLAPPAPGDYLDRCGPGPRLPLLVVSPYVDPNTVNHTQLEQASIIRFIEDNWLSGTRLGDQSFDARAGDLQTMFDFGANAAKLYLDPATGQPLVSPPAGVVTAPSGPDTTPTPTATATAVPTATPTPTPPARFTPKLAVKLKRSGRKLSLSLKVSNVNPANGRVTLTAKLKRKTKTLASSARHTVRSGRVKLVLKTRKPLKTGRYTLVVRVVQGKASATLTKTLRVR